MSNEEKETKIPEKVLEELRSREQLARQHRFTAEAIELNNSLFISKALKKMGYDTDNENYDVDMKTGEIVKNEENKNE